MAATRELKRWYRFVKEQRCANCGSHPTVDNPVEAAHMRLVVSGKTNDTLPRSHSGAAAWGCIPLCRECHHAQHDMGEVAFRYLMRPCAAEVWGTLLLRFHQEEEAPF